MNKKLESFISIASIPNLDALPQYEGLYNKGSFNRILLPSGHVAVHLTKYDQVKKALSDERFIRKPCNLDGGPNFFPTISPNELLLNNDPPDHSRLRKVVVNDFSSSSTALLKNSVVNHTIKNIENMVANAESGDLFQLVLDDIPSRIDCELLGIETDDRSYYRPLTHTIQISDNKDVPDLLRQFWLVYDYLMDMVRGTRKCNTNGLIYKFTRNRNKSDPTLNDKELVGILIGVLIGGDQNILTLLTKMVYVLLAKPQLWEDLVKDPMRIPATIDELFRLIPLGTISTFPRIAKENIKGPWGEIVKGSIIYADTFSANRDPEFFEDPLYIIPGRQAPKHIQFGYGMHNCMGMALARMEIIAVIETLVNKLPNLKLSLPVEDIKWHRGILLHRPINLPVIWGK